MGHDDFTRPERPSHVTPGVIWDYSGGYNERFDFQGNTFNLTTQHSHMTKLNEETFPGKCFGTEPTKHLHRTNQDRNALVQEGLQHDISKRSVVTNHGRLFFLQPFWDIFTTWRCTRFQSEMYIHQFDSLCVCVNILPTSRGSITSKSSLTGHIPALPAKVNVKAQKRENCLEQLPTKGWRE